MKTIPRLLIAKNKAKIGDKDRSEAFNSVEKVKLGSGEHSKVANYTKKIK